MRKVLAIVLLLALVACGKSEEGSLKASGCEGRTTTSTELTKKPEIVVPKEAPPSTLQQCDIVEGQGAEAVAGTSVTVQYVGVSWSTGRQFDASWDRGDPFVFPLGASRVIQGWDRGVVGMRIGGRRELIIPPDLGYGAQGAGGVIGPNETLVFVVDLLKVE